MTPMSLRRPRWGHKGRGPVNEPVSLPAGSPPATVATVTNERTMRVGLAGLGAAATAILEALDAHPNIVVTAAGDVRQEALDNFTRLRSGRAHRSVVDLAADPEVDAVYVATPNHLHCEHALTAIASGKDVILEKPVAVTLEECDRVIEAADRGGVRVLAGHTHSFDAPITAMASLVRSGAIGELYMLNQWYYTDWLYRGRMPAELDVGKGGGVVFRQGPHGVDIVRLLAGGPVTRVLARTTVMDPAHPGHGSYVAYLEFGSSLTATIVFSGYAFFDSSELTWGRDELGCPRDPEAHRRARKRVAGFASPADEHAYKDAVRFGGHEAEAWRAAVGGGGCDPGVQAQPFYGLTVASGSAGDLRQSEHGLYLYDGDGRHEVEVAKGLTERQAEMDVLYQAWAKDEPLEGHDARWARGTLEVCLAIIESSATGQPVAVDG
jgi:phthalate 4,5-cis-dihydrodiol dehydrogenase